MKPFAPACEKNKVPIAQVLCEVFREVGSVLEIGSGTGQHAVHFAALMAHLVWQTSDLEEHHAGIRLWLDEAGLPNVRPPLVLDVSARPWPVESVDAVFTANTLHIMSWPQVRDLFAGAGRVLTPGGLLTVYGPFNYAGEYTSPSNRDFDRWLRSRDPLSGIRDMEALDDLARDADLHPAADHAMPANNRIVVWRKAGAQS